MAGSASAQNYPLGLQILAMVDRYGSPEEKKLVSRHQTTICRFLEHPDVVTRAARRIQLDIGIENRPVLKFNLIAGRYGSPLSLIDDFANWSPELRVVSETVIQHKLHCHAGIKLTPSQVEYELYPYENSDELLKRTLFSKINFEETGLPTTPYCYGYSSLGQLSAYAEIENVAITELENALAMQLPVAGLKNRALFHSRYMQNGLWKPDKGGIEFLPFPSHLLNLVLNQLDLNFSYLLHRGGNRSYGVVGLKDNRHVLYTTLLPRMTPPQNPQT